MRIKLTNMQRAELPGLIQGFIGDNAQDDPVRERVASQIEESGTMELTEDERLIIEMDVLTAIDIADGNDDEWAGLKRSLSNLAAKLAA